MILSGPTAMGKSKLAFKLAKEINGEVIAADSVKVLTKIVLAASLLSAF